MIKLIVLLGAIGISLSAIFVRISTAPSIILVLYRVAIAALLLSPYIFVKKRDELLKLKTKDVVLCAISGLFLGLHFTAYFSALDYTSIAAAVVLVDTEVFFVAFGSILLFKERIHQKAWYGILLTFIGSIVIASILGLIIFGEVPSIYIVIGGVIVISGLTVYSKKQNNKQVLDYYLP